MILANRRFTGSNWQLRTSNTKNGSNTFVVVRVVSYVIGAFSRLLRGFWCSMLISAHCGNSEPTGSFIGAIEPLTRSLVCSMSLVVLPADPLDGAAGPGRTLSKGYNHTPPQSELNSLQSLCLSRFWRFFYGVFWLHQNLNVVARLSKTLCIFACFAFPQRGFERFTSWTSPLQIHCLSLSINLLYAYHFLRNTFIHRHLLRQKTTFCII